MHNWKRYELKQRAKNVLKLNYWIAFLVALVFIIVDGGFSFSGSSWKNNINDYKDRDYSTFSEFVEEFPEDIKGGFYFDDDLDSDEVVESVKAAAPFLYGFAIVFIFIIIIAMLFGIAFSVFVANPLKAGCKTFFKTSAEIPHKSARDMGMAFRKGNYGNVVKTMFLRDLYLFLWSLIAIIPGIVLVFINPLLSLLMPLLMIPMIVKTYEYRMVPYILADNPKYTAREAIELSRNMMRGEKWKTFVLELSFFGWYALFFIALTIFNFIALSPVLMVISIVLGLLASISILFVMPYYMATDAQLYLVLRNKAIDNSDVQSNQLILIKQEA